MLTTCRRITRMTNTSIDWVPPGSGSMTYAYNSMNSIQYQMVA